MRIATWNLESKNKLTPERKVAFHRAMAGVDADVWVLTETWTTFSPGTGYRLVSQSREADDLKLRPDRCWVSIWAKAPLVARPLEVRRHRDRMAGGRIEMPDRTDIGVVGTVLPWTSDKLWPGKSGFCAAVASQAEEWGSLHGDPDGCTFVVAGDFNQSTPHKSRYGSREGETALNDAIRGLELVCVTHGTCPQSGKPRINHICVGRKALGAHPIPQTGGWAVPTVNDQPATDHTGVFVDLKKAIVS